jgi:hypothetical protein
MVYLKRANLQYFVVPTSIGITTGFSNYNERRPKKRMGIAGRDFAGRWIFKAGPIDQCQY